MLESCDVESVPAAWNFFSNSIAGVPVCYFLDKLSQECYPLATSLNLSARSIPSYISFAIVSYILQNCNFDQQFNEAYTQLNGDSFLQSMDTIQLVPSFIRMALPITGGISAAFLTRLTIDLAVRPSVLYLYQKWHPAEPIEIPLEVMTTQIGDEESIPSPRP